MTEILASGAEAIILKKENIVQKQRVMKAYRHPQLDLKLRKTRTRREAKVYEKLTGIPTPKLISSDDVQMTIDMSFIPGQPLQAMNPQKYTSQIGKLIAQLHSNDIIHGDLTTSNMIVSEGKLHVIDFGLSFFSQKPEDKATDIHVLMQGLNAMHDENCCKEVLKAYTENYKNAEIVLKRLETVQKRGRNKK